MREPEVFLSAIEARSGFKTTFNRDDVVLVVGPNNSGKSTFLNDLASYLPNPNPSFAGRVISVARLAVNGTHEQVQSWLERNGRNMGGGNYMSRQGSLSLGDVWSFFQAGNPVRLMPMLLRVFFTGNRLGHLSPTSFISVDDAPQNAMHDVLLDETKEARLSRLMVEAFGAGVVLDRGYGGLTSLGFGSVPPSQTGDRHHPDYQRAVRNLDRLESQGDGIKAFAGIVLDLVTSDARIVLLDEPELFLHPPQIRRLTRFLASEIQSDTQIFMATHSGEVVRGMLNAGAARVRVLRLTRERGVPTLTEIPREKVSALWSVPVLRVSNALDGLFHERVVVCEGETDVRFFGAIYEEMTRASAKSLADAAFIHGGGKGKIPQLVEALRAASVPVAAVFDLDVLSDPVTLERAVLSQGGAWSSFEADYKTVVNSINSQRSDASTEYVRSELNRLLDEVTEASVPRDVARKLADVVSRASRWSSLKKEGRRVIPQGGPTQAFDRLDASLRQLSIFLVPEGEVEGFFRKAAADKGWIDQALTALTQGDRELEGATAFVRSALGSGRPE